MHAPQVSAQTYRTVEECRFALLEIMSRRVDVNRQFSQCLRGNPEFGQSQYCGIDGQMHFHKAAYSQCENQYEPLKCDLQKQIKLTETECLRMGAMDRDRDRKRLEIERANNRANEVSRELSLDKNFLQSGIKEYLSSKLLQMGLDESTAFLGKNITEISYRYIKKALPSFDPGSNPAISEDDLFTLKAIFDKSGRYALSPDPGIQFFQRIMMGAIERHFEIMGNAVAHAGQLFDEFAVDVRAASRDESQPTASNNQSHSSISQPRQLDVAPERRAPVRTQPKSESCFNILDRAIANNNISGSAKACWDRAMNEAPIGCESYLRMWRGQSGGNPARARELFRAKCQ